MTQPRPPLPYALLLPVFLVVLVDVFASTMVLPILPLYAEHLGASALEATMLISAFSACQLVSGPVLGALSDRVGRKPVLVLSQIGSCGGLVLTAVARSVGLVYVGRVVDGLTAGNISLANALVAERTPPERRSEAFSILVAAFGIGFFVGPFASSYLVRYGLGTPAWVGAALAALSVVASCALLPGGKPKLGDGGGAGDSKGAGASTDLRTLFDRRTYARYLRRPALGTLFAQFGLYTLALSSFFSGLAVFAVRSFEWGGRPFGAREVGFLFAYGGVVSVAVQGALMPALARRFDDTAIVKAGFAAFALGQFGLGLAHSLPALVAASTLITFGMNVLRPALTALISRQVGLDEQGVVLGLAQSFESLAGVASPFFGGLLLEHAPTASWAFYTGAVALAGLALALRGERPRGRLEAAGPA